MSEAAIEAICTGDTSIKLHLVGSCDREVGVLPGLDLGADEGAVIIELGIALGNHLAFLLLGGQVDDLVVVQVHLAVRNLAVGGLDETEVVDLGVDAKRRDKTDVGAFRGLNRA